MVISVGYLTLLLRPYCVLSSFDPIHFLATLAVGISAALFTFPSSQLTLRRFHD